MDIPEPRRAPLPAPATLAASLEADGRTDDTEGLQQALDELGATGGGRLFLPSGTILISKTLVLPAGTSLQGQGHAATTLRLADHSNTTMVRSAGFARLTGRNVWLASEGVPHGFGLLGLRLDGNKKHNEDGGGVEFYGKRYLVQDVMIVDTSATAFYSECATIGGQESWRDMPEACIGPLWIRGCRGISFLFRGPHDSHIDKLFVGGNRQERPGKVFDNVRFEFKKDEYDGAVDIGMLHSYAATGRGICIAAKVKAQFLIGDSCSQEGIVVEQANANSQIGMVEAFKNHFNLKDPDRRAFPNVRFDGPRLTVGVLRIRDDFGAGGAILSGDYIKVGTLEIDGKGNAGTGLRVLGSGVGVSGHIRDYNKAGGVGLETHLDTEQTTLKQLNLTIENCATGWHNGEPGQGNSFHILVRCETDHHKPFAGRWPGRDNDALLQCLRPGGSSFSRGQVRTRPGEVDMTTRKKQRLRVEHKLAIAPGRHSEVQIQLHTQSRRFQVGELRVKSWDEKYVYLVIRLARKGTPDDAVIAVTINA